MSILLVQPNKCCDSYSHIESELFKWLFSETEISVVTPTLAALNYYREQTEVRNIFDSNERETQEFKEAVRTCKGYPDRYTGDIDLTTTLWKQKYQFKGDYIHGLDCFENTGCITCTPYSICRENDERRTEKRRQLAHSRKSNVRRRKSEK
jgi:hypothetical protein